MKKRIVLLLTFIAFGFNTSQNPIVSLKVTGLKPQGADKCDVALELHNESNRRIDFLSMYCSDSGFYVTDNPDVAVIPMPCNKNFPISVPLLRNRYRTGQLTLQMLKNTKTKFRIGFKFVEIPQGISFTDFDSSTVKSITVWSNTLEFKGR